MQIAGVYEILQARTGLPAQPDGMRAAAQAAGIPGVGTPDTAMRAIHIAGTNGKGSTAAMLDAILREAGHKVGLCTSPHLLRFTERIRVNGKEIEEALLPGLLEAALQAEQKAGARLNYFALVTLMGLVQFTREGCGWCILEAGLGGRLDPTNCLDAPALAIITRIGLDHMALLGNSMEEIAGEKAGIIKRGCDVVLAEQELEADVVLRRACTEAGARLHAVGAGPHAPHWNGQPLELGLQGEYQLENAATVLLATRVLQEKGVRISEGAVREGMRKARWPGRFQWMNAHTLLDGAHNPQGALALRNSLEKAVPGRKHIFLMGFMADKAYEEIIGILAPLARAMIALPAADTPRALQPEQLRETMREYCAGVYAAGSLQEGLALAERLRGQEDGIVICGSLYLMGRFNGE